MLCDLARLSIGYRYVRNQFPLLFGKSDRKPSYVLIVVTRIQEMTGWFYVE